MVASRRVAVVAVVAAVAAVALTACKGADSPAGDRPAATDGVRIASFNFRESELLAEMYAQIVESTGTPVVRMGPVGPREVAMPALELDLVDVVPEYLGTALRWQGETASAPDAEVAIAALEARLEPIGLAALRPAPAENENVVVVATATAERERLAAVSDLRPLAPQMRFGGPPECPDRPFCLIGLEEVYGLRFEEFVVQRSQQFTAEALRRGEIDVGLMFSTEPGVTALDLTVLVDDRRLQPAENVVPVVRTEAIDRWGPELVTALDSVSAALTTSTLRLLNRRVGDGAAIEQVTRDWLRAAGVIAP